MSSALETPKERCCFARKYLPASNKQSKGKRPTNSEPVTRIPLLSAFLQTSSNLNTTLSHSIFSFVFNILYGH